MCEEAEDEDEMLPKRGEKRNWIQIMYLAYASHSRKMKTEEKHERVERE